MLRVAFVLRSTEVIPVFFDLFHEHRRLAQPATGSGLTRQRPSHHPAREELGSWCEGCCGCERASAREKLKLVYQHLLGRLLLVKAAAKALCLIRRALSLRVLRITSFGVVAASTRVSRILAHRPRVVNTQWWCWLGFAFRTNPPVQMPFGAWLVGRAASRASSGTQKPG